MGLKIIGINVLDAQIVVDMDYAIELSILNSDLAKIAKLKLNHSQNEFKLTKKNFLPKIGLSATTPVYSKATTRVTIPSGEDIFVGQNQIFNDFGINIEQSEPLFNGTFQLWSRLNRIDILGVNPSTSFFSRPISLSYSNSNLIFNPRKWDDEIAEAELNLDLALYYEELAIVQMNVVELYFKLAISQNEIKNKKKHRKRIKEIKQLIVQKLELGYTPKNEIYAIQIELLEIEHDIKQAEINKQLLKNQLANLLGLKPNKFEIDTTLKSIPYLVVLPESMSQIIQDKNSTTFQFKKDNLNLKKDIQKTRREDLIDVNLDMSFGLSNTSESLNKALSNLIDQQFFSVSINLNLFDFGRRKEAVNLLLVEQKWVELEYKEQMKENQFKIQAIINKINNYAEMLKVIDEAKKLALINYNNFLERFPLGSITVNDLNLAYQKVEDLNLRYIEAVMEYCLAYYELRKETLYDFNKQEWLKF